MKWLNTINPDFDKIKTSKSDDFIGNISIEICHVDLTSACPNFNMSNTTKKKKKHAQAVHFFDLIQILCQRYVLQFRKIKLVQFVLWRDFTHT